MKLRLAIVFLLLTTSSYAGNNNPTNFQLNSPPIPYPGFSVGSADSSIAGSYQHVSEGSVTLTGGGIDYKGRLAPTEHVALGLELPANYISGKLGSDYGSGSMSTKLFGPTINLQLQLYHEGNLALTAYGGFNYNYQTFKADETDLGVTSDIDGTIKTKAFPLGVQLGLPFLSFELAPFFSYTHNSGGSADFSVASNGASSNVSVSIPKYTSRSYGFDVILPKEAISLSTLLQDTKAARAGEKNMKTFMFQLGMLLGIKAK